MIPPRDERGAATALVLAALSLLMLVALALVHVAGMVRAQRSAQAAADLAALAGAVASRQGLPPCDRAAEIAVGNGASLVECMVRGAEVSLTVSVPGPQWRGHGVDLRARARAGPAVPPPEAPDDG